MKERIAGVVVVVDHGKLLALADRVDNVCTRMTSKDGFLSPESDPRRLLWQIRDELREPNR